MSFVLCSLSLPLLLSAEGKHTQRSTSLWETSAIISLPLTFLLTGGIRTVSRVGLTQLAVAYKEKDMFVLWLKDVAKK